MLLKFSKAKAVTKQAGTTIRSGDFCSADRRLMENTVKKNDTDR
jgi:hypothetical protein